MEQIIRGGLLKNLSGSPLPTSNVPFRTHLLGDRHYVPIYEFIHAIYSHFGISIFEDLIVALAEKNPGISVVKLSYKVGTEIGEKTYRCIEDIMDGLGVGIGKSDKIQELDRIRKSVGEAQSTKSITLKRASIYLEMTTGDRVLIDIKVPKNHPDRRTAREFKRRLLRWAGVEMQKVADVEVHSFMAIPYNNSFTERYTTGVDVRDALDLEEELKVDGEFWDFLAGKPVHEDLLKAFLRVGMDFYLDLEKYFPDPDGHGPVISIPSF
ncbi:MAG: TdeIII family type II restriction endonuclease [Cytophagales bacterium]|nr:TdeIII family type II restriction endonuclease [Cytophagales bacterium]